MPEHAKQHYWHIRLSYRRPSDDPCGRRWRDNAEIGVLAPTIQTAIALALKAGVPEGGDQPIVWCASHHGCVDVIAGESDA